MRTTRGRQTARRYVHHSASQYEARRITPIRLLPNREITREWQELVAPLSLYASTLAVPMAVVRVAAQKPIKRLGKR